MNGRVASTQWISSLLARTVSRGEVTSVFLGIPGYKHRIDDPEEDSDREQCGKISETKGRWFKKNTRFPSDYYVV